MASKPCVKDIFEKVLLFPSFLYLKSIKQQLTIDFGMLNPAHSCIYFLNWGVGIFCFWGDLHIIEQNPQDFSYQTVGLKTERPVLLLLLPHQSERHCSGL